MKANNLGNFESKDSTVEKALSFCALQGVGWVLAVLSIISIGGIIFSPLFIAGQVFASRFVKRKLKDAAQNARTHFERAGYNVTHELHADGAHFLIDQPNRVFAYWYHGVMNFTPGIASLDEVTEFGWVKDGDIIRPDPVMNHMTKREVGNTHFAIKFNRFEQPIFKFRVRSADKADLLLQQFQILAN